MSLTQASNFIFVQANAGKIGNLEENQARLSGLKSRRNENKMSIKLVFFDLEGTLLKPCYEYDKYKHLKVAPSLWTLIAEHLGNEALKEEELTKQKWTKGKYRGYIEWMEDTIKIHVKYGLTKRFFMNLIKQRIKYYRGVKETLNELRKRNIKTALITGGFKQQADLVQKELKIDHSFAACEYFFDSKGKLVWFNLLPADYEGKIDFMRLLMREYKLNKQEVAFVGDGKNDIPLAKEVGISICFNGDPELARHCTYSINQPKGKEDFRSVLKYLLD